jgi:hypothetical protein
MLLSLGLLSGCAGKPAEIVDKVALCKDWQHKTVSKDDVLTDGTASILEADNKSRVNWGCKWGANTAKVASN